MRAPTLASAACSVNAKTSWVVMPPPQLYQNCGPPPPCVIVGNVAIVNLLFLAFGTPSFPPFSMDSDDRRCSVSLRKLFFSAVLRKNSSHGKKPRAFLQEHCTSTSGPGCLGSSNVPLPCYSSGPRCEVASSSTQSASV